MFGDHSRSSWLLLGSLLVLAACAGSLWLLEGGPRSLNGSSDTRPLTVFCAAGFRKPMAKIVQRYQDELGVQVQVQYGGSNTLLGQIEAGQGNGDLYLAAENYYMNLAQERGLVEEAEEFAYQRPVIVTAKGNPKQIQDVEDLARQDVRVSFGNPEQAAIGRKASRLLRDAGLWEAIEANILQRGVFKPTVPETANDVLIGAVNAAVVWDALAVSYPDLEVVRSPVLDAGRASLILGVLKKTRSPAASLAFLRFLTASDRGLEIVAEAGFQVADGDPWSPHPELTLYAGAVNRKALQPVIERFQEREGVRINTTFNGCGILTAQMRSLVAQDQGGFPDMFMACDEYYLNEVSDLFGEGTNVSDARIVLVVQPGNPKNIRTLQDLLQPGVRIAIGQPEQCTIGVLTRRLLQQEGVWDAVQEHVATQVASSAQLVPAVITQSVDAVLAYETDTLAERQSLQVIPIDSTLAKATQPYSVSRSTPYKHLAARFRAALLQSRQSFEDAGFHWRWQPTPTAAEGTDGE